VGPETDISNPSETVIGTVYKNNQPTTLSCSVVTSDVDTVTCISNGSIPVSAFDLISFHRIVPNIDPLEAPVAVDFQNTSVVISSTP